MQSSFSSLANRKAAKGPLVAETCVELLYLETVRLVQRQYPVNVLIESGIAPEKARAECDFQVHTKLENMGFQMGVRVMENILKDQVCSLASVLFLLFVPYQSLLLYIHDRNILNCYLSRLALLYLHYTPSFTFFSYFFYSL